MAVQGFNTCAIVVDEATYGTLAASGQKAVAFVSESLSRNYEKILNTNNTCAGASMKKSEAGNIIVEGDIVVNLDYDNIVPWLRYALGAISIVPGPPVVNTYDPAEEMNEPFSFVVDRDIKRHQFLGCVVEQMVLSWNAADNKGQATFSIIGQDRVLSDTAILSATLTDPEDYIKFADAVFRIGDLSDALSSSDAMGLQSFELTVVNHLETPKPESGTSGKIIQPKRDTQREVTLVITASRFATDAEHLAILTAGDSYTDLQADITFSGTGTDELIIELPQMRVEQTPNLNTQGAQQITFETTLNAFLNEDNSDMSAVAKDMRITLTDT